MLQGEVEKLNKGEMQENTSNTASQLSENGDNNEKKHRCSTRAEIATKPREHCAFVADIIEEILKGFCL